MNIAVSASSVPRKKKKELMAEFGHPSGFLRFRCFFGFGVYSVSITLRGFFGFGVSSVSITLRGFFGSKFSAFHFLEKGIRGNIGIAIIGNDGFVKILFVRIFWWNSLGFLRYFSEKGLRFPLRLTTFFAVFFHMRVLVYVKYWWCVWSYPRIYPVFFYHKYI